MKKFMKREMVVSVLVMATMAVFSIADLLEDIQTHENIFQIIYETFVFSCGIFGVGVLLNRNTLLKKEISTVRSQLTLTHTEAKKWKDQHQNLLDGLGQAIDKQLSTWHLSSSEKEIALFLLKGLSFKEIADIRGTNEKTVRQQSISVYNKSGVAGRSELSAFFLEDVLSPLENGSGENRSGENTSRQNKFNLNQVDASAESHI